ncbi:glycine-rich domain-containing protein [Aeromonas veronii]|uniref:glycine-rich domain-containing protein n=1 Tax=Aeromonas veronii TaxID=654 RepID=UPI003BA3BE3E
MANLQEVVSWEAGIYQLETGDPVLGGPGGISNKQAQALANRTAYLKKHVDDIEGGNTAAGKADKLSTARNIALGGDVTGQASFDGSGNITITTTYKNSGVVAGTYRSVTVDAKGNITAGSNPTTLAGYGITDAVPSAQKGAANGVATLDGSGKVPVNQIPATAITDTFVVNTQAAMLALTAEVGDIAVRTDLNKSFILRVAGAATLANWQELLTPTDSVQSVDGMTGAVTIATASEAVKGKAQISTQAEVNAGTDDTKFVTALKLAKVGIQKQIATFKQVGVTHWVVPTGVYKVLVTVIGAGGGGGGASSSTNYNASGGGGGAGGYAKKLVNVSPGDSIPITIGTGGKGAQNGTVAASPGQTSSFGTFCSATGGSPGNSAVGGSTSSMCGAGGGGGLGSGGDIDGYGGHGSAGIASAPSAAGGSVGQGQGGTALASLGRGGNGGATVTGNQGAAGQDGLNGIVIVEW